MRRRITALLGIGLAAVVAVGAIAADANEDQLDTGGLLPLAEEGLPEPDLSDVDLFIDGEPITVGATISPAPLETGGLTPLAPEGTEPAPSDFQPFIEGEPRS